MRMMLRVTVPVETGNVAIKDGRLQRVIQSAIQTLQPEASYFTTFEGRRSGFFVFDLKDPSQIPAIAEPFFLELNASVEFAPVMNAEDLAKGLQAAFQTA